MASDPSSVSTAALRELVERFADLRVVVWGDLVADRFLQATTTRISREAPALVVQYENELTTPGGAGNAAMNSATLGAAVRLVGFLGVDSAAESLRTALGDAAVDCSGLVPRNDGATPVKTRVMAGGPQTVRQQILRIDNDRPWPGNDGAETALQEILRAGIADADAVLISDYGLGSVSPQAFAAVRDDLRDRISTLDSRYRMLDFHGTTAATPNEQEVAEALGGALGAPRGPAPLTGDEIRDRLGCRFLLITRGSAGMSLFEAETSERHLPIHGTDQIADVTGAGDTVIATFTLALAAGGSAIQAAHLANVAAGLVVLKHGTATISAAELLAALGDI